MEKQQQSPSFSFSSSSSSSSSHRFRGNNQNINYNVKSTFKLGSGTAERAQVSAGLRRDRRHRTVALKRRRPAAPHEQKDITLLSFEEIKKLVNEANSSNADKRKQSVKKLRKTLCHENPPIQEVLDADIIPTLSKHINSSDDENQLEAAWCLTNIAIGNTAQTQQTLDAIPYMINILHGQNTILQEQAVSFLSNVAGDISEFRDVIIRNGAIPPLIDILHSSKIPSLTKNTLFCLSNVSRQKREYHPLFFESGITQPLIRHLQSKDPEIVTEACWCASYLTAGIPECLAALVDGGIIPVLVHIIVSNFNNNNNNNENNNELSSPMKMMDTMQPCLRALGNVFCGPNDYIDSALSEHRLLYALYSILQSPSRKDAKETAWVISNIAGGDLVHVEALVNANFIPLLCHLLKHASFVIKREVAFALTNICGHKQFVPIIAENNGINGFVSILETAEDVELVMMTLTLFEHLLADPEARRYINNDQLKEVLEHCQDSMSRDIGDKSTVLLERFFAEEEMPASFDESNSPLEF